MSISVLFNGVVYEIPEVGEETDWGNDLNDYFIALAQGALQKTGGNFTLTADVNFGPNYGLLAKYFSTVSLLPATIGAIRLSFTDEIFWRNNDNTEDLGLGVNALDELTFNGVAVGSAAITSLTGDVTAVGPGAAAATVVTVGGSSAVNIHSGELLANAATAVNVILTTVFRNAAGNFAAGTITADLTGVATHAVNLTDGFGGSIPYQSADSVTEMLDNGTAGQLLQSNGGFLAPSWVAAPTTSPLTTKGDVFGFSTLNDRIPVGTDGQVLTADSTQALGLNWETPAAAPVGVITIDRFSGDSVETDFILSVDPLVEENTSVYISGVYQQKDTYSISGTTLTFGIAPPTGVDIIEVVTGSIAPLGVGTVADGSITTNKLADGSVTFAKRAPRPVGNNLGIVGAVAMSEPLATFSGSSLSFVDITNLSVTLTTSGGPVFVGLIPYGTGGVIGGFNCRYRIIRDPLLDPDLAIGGTLLTFKREEVGFNASIPASSLTAIHWDVDIAGTHTYQVQVRSEILVSTGLSESYYCADIRLIAYEL